MVQVVLMRNFCLPQFSFLPFQISTFALALLENDGQIISVGLEFGLPYDITSVLENSMGQTLTSISLLGGKLCKLTSSQTTLTSSYSGYCAFGQPVISNRSASHHRKKEVHLSTKYNGEFHSLQVQALCERKQEEGLELGPKSAHLRGEEKVM